MSYLTTADKIPRTNSGYRVTDGNIAAIDFGTTSVSLAYTTKGDKQVLTLPLDTEAKSTRILNVVLLKKEGCKMKVEAFGANAKKRFVSLRPGAYADYIYFERIKMLMRREKAVDRQSKVESFSGNKYYLVEVIAFILQYLKDQLIDHLSRTVKPLKTTDFDWVITVPAIWDARGKRMMREAAYLAGLLTESGGIDHLTGLYSTIPLPNEVNPDKLSLALEPESAALYSQEVTGAQIEGDPSKAAISRPTEYMVIDIGGGTVDITAHIEKSGSIQVDNIPTGNAWGGTQVNEAFSQLLQKLVRDPDYKKFIALGEHSKQMAIVNGILYDEFETQKISFGQCKNKEMAIELNAKFASCYDEAIKQEVTKMKGIEYEDDRLYIDESLAESHLFGPTLRGIIDCTIEAIKESGSRINTFYLVGGFGGCKYIHEKVTAAIKKVKGSCNVVVPVDPHLAVATGAAMWRKIPEKIKARRSDATYGIAMSIPFNSGKHDEHYKYFDDEDKIYRCKKAFCVFLEKGEMANADEVIVSRSMRPDSKATTKMSIIIYSMPNVGVKYTVDKKGNSTVTKVGEIVLDVPNPNKLPEDERMVDVTMDFSGTEIQAKAKYRVTGKEVKTVCDFLSAQ